MTTLIDSRRSPGGARRQRPLEGGLARLGTRNDSALARVLAHPLSDYYLVMASAALLVGLGVLMVLSASSVWSSVMHEGDAYYYLVRQMVFLSVGLPTAWWLSRRHASVLQVFGWLGMIGSIVLLALVFTPLGVEEFGNRAWLRIGALGTIQPSEFAKASLILWSAAVLANRTKTLNNPKRLLFPFLLGFGVILGLVLMQKDVGTALVIALIMFAMLWFVGAPVRILLGLGSVGLVGVGALVVTDPERMSRIFSFLGHSESVSDQPMNAIYALASGGWW
ncbi:MAG: FtsW/RodA/SpoVE family cell cycle protein, partial [Brooklawnia sp.]